ncbi:MAG: NAD(P)/FAD-dependent oxidoreductase [Patescibacteria group bacterium]
MSSKHSFDVIVIGGGSAGLSAAHAARSLGARVCLIEKGNLGGECPNDACVPSKALLRAAKFYRSLQDAKRFGFQITAPVVSFSEIMRYRDVVVERVTGGQEENIFAKQLKASSIDIRFGVAHFEDEHLISVNGEQIYGKSIVLATGSVDFVPPIQGLASIHFLTWKDLFSKKRQPKSLAVIGGGPVACEIATFYATFGTRVVLLQSASRILHRDDEDCSLVADEQMRRLGIEIITNATVTEVIDGRGGVYGVKVDVHGTQSMHAVEQIVLAAGKRMRTENLGLEDLSFDYNELGFLNTSNDQQTSLPHIFAAGDANGGQMFTHTAHEEGSVAGFNAARCALKKRISKRFVDERVVPRVTFTEPEIASVGATAEEVKKKFGQVAVGRVELSELHRSFTDHEPIGFMKLVAHPKSHKILGGHIVSAHAGEVIHEIALGIFLNITAEKLASMIHAYPTYSEGVRIAASRMKTI